MSPLCAARFVAETFYAALGITCGRTRRRLLMLLVPHVRLSPHAPNGCCTAIMTPQPGAVVGSNRLDNWRMWAWGEATFGLLINLREYD